MRKLDPNEVFANCALMEWKEYASPAELEEFERWSKWISAEDKKEARRGYRYRGHIDKYCDFSLADGGGEENYLDKQKLARLGYVPDLLEDYLSSDPEAIHEFFVEEALSSAVKRCTPRQKQALHCYLIPKIKTADIALILGTSDRNVLKLLATARKNILSEIGATK